MFGTNTWHQKSSSGLQTTGDARGLWPDLLTTTTKEPTLKVTNSSTHKNE